MSLIRCAHCGEDRDLTLEGGFVRGVKGIQGVPFVCDECRGDSYKPGHSSNELAEPEEFGLDSDTPTEEEMDRAFARQEAAFSDDVIPSQREVA